MKGTPVNSRTTTVKLTLLAAGALLALSACGSSSPTTAVAGQPAGNAGYAGGQTAGQTGGQAGGGTGFGAGRFPGTIGTIAEVDGKTLQVQNQSTGQVAVTWSGSTSITAEVTASLADVKVGSCVSVMPVRSASGTAGASGAGTTPAATSGPVAAGEVRITQATNGSCVSGFGGGAGRRFRGTGSGAAPSGAPSSLPSAAANGMPSGAPGGFAGRTGGFGFGASGKVTAVTAKGFTVAARSFDPSDPSATPSTHAVQVTVSGSTTYTTSKKATGSALKVGKCVTATGKSNDTGAVTASRIQVSDPVDGSCGFGGFGGSRG